MTTVTSPMWTTHDGRRIYLSEMEDTHLLNIERMLIGRGAEDWGDRDRLHGKWYQVIRREIDARDLKMLADHPNTQQALQHGGEHRPHHHVRRVVVNGKVAWQCPARQCQPRRHFKPWKDEDEFDD